MRVESLKVANLEYLFVPHIPFPWGRFSIFHPDTIYQLCLSDNLLNAPLPFLSLLTRLGWGFSCWTSQHLRSALFPWCIFFCKLQVLLCCSLGRTPWKLMVPSVWTDSIPLASLRNKTSQACPILFVAFPSSRDFSHSWAHPDHSTQTGIVQLASDLQSIKPVAHLEAFVYLSSRTEHFFSFTSYLPGCSFSVSVACTPS